MARIKRSVNALKKRRKVMKLAKGYWGAKSKQYRAASEQVARSLRYAFKGRKLRKRDFRSLWITRINAEEKRHRGRLLCDDPGDFRYFGRRRLADV